MPELSARIRDATSIEEIARYLDALAPDAREAESIGLLRRDQARLFEKAADAPASRLADFVPSSVPNLTQVIHRGRNTIATFRYFQAFEKRFARPEASNDLLYGYNESNAFFIHPGYFVAYETDALSFLGGQHPPRPPVSESRHLASLRSPRSSRWAERGGVVIDYHRIPDATVPVGWPKVVPNDHGLQKLVYHLTRDFMRRVSAHVTIGRASREDERGDRLLDYWFTLCRRDAGATRNDPT